MINRVTDHKYGPMPLCCEHWFPLSSIEGVLLLINITIVINSKRRYYWTFPPSGNCLDPIQTQRTLELDQAFPFRGREGMIMKSLGGQPPHTQENEHCSKRKKVWVVSWQLVFKYFQRKVSSPPKGCLLLAEPKPEAEPSRACPEQTFWCRSATNLSLFCEVPTASMESHHHSLEKTVNHLTQSQEWEKQKRAGKSMRKGGSKWHIQKDNAL